MKHNKKAFTLIELLVVVLIIGILAAIALPKYEKAVKKARNTEVLLYINSVTKALDVYILANGIPQGEFEYNFPLDIEVPASIGYYFCGSGLCQVEANCKGYACILSAVREEGDSDWSKHCTYASVDDPDSKTFCESLQSFGFSTDDMQEEEEE